MVSAMAQEPEDDRPLFLRKRYPRPGKPREYEERSFPLAAGEAKPYAAAALQDEVSQLLATPEGERNHRLNIAGFNLGQLVGAGHLDREEAWHALHTTALSIGLTPTETGNTLRSGFAAGEAQPREVKDLEPSEEAPDATVFQLGEDPDAPDWGTRFPRLDWHHLWEAADEEEWIVEPLIPARRLVALFSAPKMGKSLLLLELAVQVARGEEVLGYRPEKPRRVLYVDFENDPRGDIKSRLVAMGMNPGDLDNLVYLSFPPLAGLDTSLGGLELLAVAQFYGCDLVVIDTISRAVVGEENENDTWLSFYRHTGKRLKAAEIACVRLDHTGKDLAKGMRGGSAKYGDVDVVWSMTKLTETTFRLECTANRLPIHEKVLLLERKIEPLRHAVSMKRIAEVLDVEDRRLLDLLADLGVPADAGRPRVLQALHRAGEVDVRERKARHLVELRNGSRVAPPQELSSYQEELGGLG